MILLHEGPLFWDEIKIQLNVTASGMLPQIKILEDNGLIVKKDRKYTLTDIGRLIAYHLKTFDNTLKVIEQQKKYWQEHNCEVLPHDIFVRIGEIKNSRTLERGLEETFVPHKQLFEMIRQSKKVACISPIVHPMYQKFFLSLAKEDREVRLILTKKAYNKIRTEYYDMLLEGLQYEKASLSICDEDIRFASTVTDIHFSMNLFMKNGIFDSTTDIVSNDPSAIKLGEDLFSHYQKRSSPINKEEIY